jgi:glycosyltransferase involved in cell wall biosynthesis
MNNKPRLAIILPCFNEEAVLNRTITRIDDLLQEMIGHGEIADDSYAMYVDDGSQDGTWRVISTALENHPHMRAIRFAGNAGHQNALIAGMDASTEIADCAVTIDADLQDDITVIPDMVRQFREGSHIVYGVRRERGVDTPFKRKSAEMFYSFMHFLGAPIIPGHADFRLVSKFAMETLKEYRESNIFLRSVFPGMNLRSSSVFYARKTRELGETKYPLRKMISFATKGITMSSLVPLRIAGLLSILSFLLAIALTIHALVSYFTGNVVPGWTSQSLVILYLGSMQLFCLAVLGEYIANVFIEVKHRPRYRIEQCLDGKGTNVQHSSKKNVGTG